MAWPGGKEKFIEDVVSNLPQKIQHKIRERLTVAVEHDDTKDAWRACETETKALTREEHDRKHADYVIELACKPAPKSAPHDQVYLVYGIYSNWVEERDLLLQDLTYLRFGPFSLTHEKAVIRGLVGEGCPVAKELGERIIRQLNARLRE